MPFILQISYLEDQKALVEIESNKMPDHMNREHKAHSKVKAQKCLVAKDDGMVSDIAYTRTAHGVWCEPASFEFNCRGEKETD